MQSQDTGRKSTFGRNMMQYIANQLPFSGVDMVKDLEKINPKYRDFYKTGSDRETKLSRHAISQRNPYASANGAGGIQIDENYHQFMYANIDHDKGKRLRDYRIMAAFAEVGDAINEICDSAIVKDEETNKIIKLEFENESPQESEEKEELKKEFQKFIRYFDLEKNGWDYFRRLLIEGELFFEHIIHEEHKDMGILGVISIPSDIVDPIYNNIQNHALKGFLLRKPLINPKTRQIEKWEYIPFDKNQITYMHSNMWSEDKSMRLPHIENCRRAYRQLSLIEDSIVIYRLNRAPERLVFNVDVTGMPAPNAEAYLKKLMHNYWSRKTYDHSQGGTVNAFSPQSMMDSFWFAKRAGSEGTTVTSLPGGQNLGELTDLMYFVRKLYKSLGVPENRLNPESRTEDSATILREELDFAKMIMRIQQHFANSLKDSFIVHLKLKGMWDEYNLSEKHFEAVFNPPSHFHTFRQQQLLDLKTSNFTALAASENISTSYMQKMMLGWSDEQIKYNRNWLEKDAEHNWKIQQIMAMGPNWEEQLKAAAGGEEAAAGGGSLADGASPTGGGMPDDGMPAGDTASGEGMPAGEEGPAPTPAGSAENTALPG